MTAFATDTSNVGGICGSLSETDISNCYWNLDSNQTVNDIIRIEEDKKGIGDGEDTAISLTTALMKGQENQANYAGFDFEDVWAFKDGENDNYPILPFSYYPEPTQPPTTKQPTTETSTLPTTEPTTQPVLLYGDVNGDGQVNATDALLVLKISVGRITATPQQEIAADVTGDGNINSSDALLILKYAVGRIPEFPIEVKK